MTTIAGQQKAQDFAFTEFFGVAASSLSGGNSEKWFVFGVSNIITISWFILVVSA